MSETKTRFRTNQEDYFGPANLHADDVAPAANNGKLIALVALGILIAASLATLLSGAI